MAVKLRLSRIGKKHVPFFRIVAIDSRKKRDGACLENLGTYDVLNGKFVQFHEERINDWIAKGAEVTDSVKKLHRQYKEGSSSSSTPAKVKAPKAAKKTETSSVSKETH